MTDFLQTTGLLFLAGATILNAISIRSITRTVQLLSEWVITFRDGLMERK